VSNLLKCCCGCASSYRVFVPCDQSAPFLEPQPVAMTTAQLTACGFDYFDPADPKAILTVYLYDPPADCDPYCGTWRCLEDADDEANQCHPDDPGGCPACAEWDAVIGPPYRIVRAAEMTAFCGRFTAVDSCCDDDCPRVDCGFGYWEPGDCVTCYDVADLSWALTVTGSGTIQGVTVKGYTIDCLGVSAANVVASTVGSTLEIEFDVVYQFQTSPTPQNWDCTGTSPDPVGCIECADPGLDTFPDTFQVIDKAIILVACMTAPTITVGLPGGSFDPSTYCGGYSTATVLTSLLINPSTSTTSDAIGWGGNARCLTSLGTRDISIANHPHLGDTMSTLGELTFTVALDLSLPPRPDPCV